MIYELLKLPLPIYDRLEKQYRAMKANVPSKVIASRDRILPFQFVIPIVAVTADITEWTLRLPDIARTVYADLTSQADKLELIETAAGETYVIWKPQHLGIVLPVGVYHMEFTIRGGKRYSEQFQVTCDSPLWENLESRYTMLEWDNDGCDMNPIMYATGYKNRLYLDGQIFNEAPTIVEEGSEDGNGRFIPTLRKYIANFKIEDVIPFYIADALTVLVMHKNVVVTLPFATYTGVISEIKPTTVQEENTWLYRFTMTFQTEHVYQTGACCEPIKLPEVVPPVEPGCNATIENLAYVEDNTGLVTVNWDVFGDCDRVLLQWISFSFVCPQTGSQILIPEQFSYQIPEPFKKSNINFIVTPQCEDGLGGYTNLVSKNVMATLTKGPDCVPAPDPEPEPEPTAAVQIMNQTFSMAVYDVIGIPGFSSPAVAPQGSFAGTHTGEVTGSILVRYDGIYADFKRVKVYVNAVAIFCEALSSGGATTVPLLMAIPVDADILIEVSDGYC